LENAKYLANLLDWGKGFVLSIMVQIIFIGAMLGLIYLQDKHHKEVMKLLREQRQIWEEGHKVIIAKLDANNAKLDKILEQNRETHKNVATMITMVKRLFIILKENGITLKDDNLERHDGESFAA